MRDEIGRGGILRDTDVSAKRRLDPMIWLIPLMLSGLGVIMVISTTSSSSFVTTGTPFVVGLRQVKWLVFGLLAMFAAYSLPVRVWHKIAPALWLVSTAAVILTLVPGVGSAVGGARRWLRLAGISIQPSEILSFAIVFYAARISIKHDRDQQKCFAIITGVFIVSCIPLMMQPDLGSTILIASICMGIYTERYGWKRPLALAAVGVVLLVLVIRIEPYRMRRFLAFSDPWADPYDTGYQTVQGLIAAANGGLWGTGLGHGFQKLNYLPAADTDFIFAALGEELGLLGSLSVLALCFFWTMRGRALYNRMRDGFETSCLWGMVLTVILPFFINIAGVTNSIPMTGMPLPFVSYGGSSLVMMWVRIGVILKLQREGTEELDR